MSKGDGKNAPLCRGTVQKQFPDLELEVLDPLGHIWDKVVERIIGEMMQLSIEDTTPLHINIRAEMALELAKLQFWLSECVVNKRTVDRQLEDIEPEQEREECLGPAGEHIISGTAQLVFDRIWSKRMKERWEPKSAKAIERDKNPKEPSILPVKPVTKNHFIPLSFIRDYWSWDGFVRRWRKKPPGAWSSALRPFGQWGYGHKLYSDWLEAYLSLLEGDATRPIKKLLAVEPLNDPEQNAVVAFLIIQLLRNPRFIEVVHAGMIPMIAKLGHGDDPDMLTKSYEAMFRNNELYDLLARPIKWSRWAIVRSEKPVFVLPDRFCLQGAWMDGLRIIAPLTPNACFVTLPTRESEKRVVPWHVTVDDDLAQSISAALMKAAAHEFLSHSTFRPVASESTNVFDLLKAIEDTVRAKADDYQ